jgi:hypothetical protein
MIGPRAQIFYESLKLDQNTLNGGFPDARAGAARNIFVDGPPKTSGEPANCAFWQFD